ncbi:MAG: 2Fe-2S iron-sulfur cluster-binding protein, partial [Streptosporangiaceae bacterium]
LLDHHPDPSAEQIRAALSGQICRCTGYENIVRSVLWASRHEASRHEAGQHGAGQHGAAAPRAAGPGAGGTREALP